MPRNPAAKKNQHNNRHENGLVGPGKRVTKQKSNGQLNGSVKPAVPDQPAPTSSSTESQQQNSSSVTTPTESPFDSKPTSVHACVVPSFEKRNSESSIEGHEQKWENASASVSTVQKRLGMAPLKSKASADLSAMQVASTILRSCPAGDTVALLIVLLALPSMVLTIVQVLFASMTLMPPNATSAVSFLSLFDVFQEGTAGSPSLGTMAMMDIFFFGFWICLWNWAKNFALDLAQIQIAITLGNGNSRSSSINTFCFSIVLLLHLVRSKGIRRFILSATVPENLLAHPRISQLAQFLPSDQDFGDTPGSPSWIPSFFALHILSQALMAFVRRKVAGTSGGTSSKSNKRTDTEASVGGSNHFDSSAQDFAFNTAASSGVDYHPPVTTTVKENKDKFLSAKRRKRQATQVRSRQPFWAALASTKVHVLREVEQHKGHPSTASTVESPFRNESSDIVWITEVEPSTIQFEATYATSTDQLSRSQPFFVRVNGARWHSVNLEPAEDDSEAEDFPTQWCGTISGLAPDFSYSCVFIRAEDEEEFASVMVRTPPVSDGDQANHINPAPARQSLRSSSPATTLKNSIQAAESKRDDANNRRNKARKNHKSALAKMDREIDSWNMKLKSAGDDNRLRQKLLQAERSSRQHEETTQSIIVALEDLKSIPEEETEEHDKHKAAFEESSNRLSEANESLVVEKANAANETLCTNNELSATLARKERLVARNAKLTAEHDRFTQANIQGMNEKERKAAESAAREADQQKRAADLTGSINEMIAKTQEFQGSTNLINREIEHLERQAAYHREMMLKSGGNLTPEGNLPGTNPPQYRGTVYGNGFHSSSYIPDPNASPFFSFVKTLPSENRRPRSDTNRSIGAMSGFSIDFEDADPIPPMPTNVDFDLNELNGRKDSGSSRSKNNGSPAAGVIGEGLRSSQPGTHSPGQIQGTNTW